MDQQEERNDSAATAESSDGQGRKRRRRRRGKKREGEPSDGTQDTADSASDSDDDDGDDAGSERPAQAGGEDGEASDADPQRKKKRRRKKKKGPGGADDASAEPVVATDKPAEPREPREAREPREPRPERRQEKPDRPDRPERPARSERPGRQQDEKEKKTPPSRGMVLKRRMSKIDDGTFDPEPPQVVQVFMPPHNVATVDAYINHLRGWQREVVTALRNIITKAAPELEESILWSQPVYSSNGPVCYIKAFSDHVNLGFWRGTELEDPDNLLVGELFKMRHVRINHMQDIRRDMFEIYVRQASRLNKERGDPTQQ